MPWISVSERLPEKDGVYSTIREWGKGLKASGHDIFCDGAFVINYEWDECLGEILGWWEE